MSATDRQRRWFVVILVTAAALRVAWVFYAGRGVPPNLVAGDQFSYYSWARHLAAGENVVNPLDGGPTAYYPVGYPALLAVLFWFVEHTPFPNNIPKATGLLQAALGTASVGLVFIIGRRLFGARAGLIAAAISAVFPNLIFYVATYQLETTFTFLALAATAVLVTHDWSTGTPSRNRLLAFGALLGLAVLVRPFALPFLVGLTIAVLVAGAGWQRAARAIGWALLPLVLIQVPWTVRNVVTLDSFVIGPTNLGDTLCLDRSEDATGRFRFADHEGCVDPELGEVPRNSGNTRKALRFVVEHPVKEAELIGRRAFEMSKHDDDGLLGVETLSRGPFLGHRVRTVLSWTGNWFYYAVLLVAAIGLPAFFRRRDPARLFTGVALVSLVVVPLLLWGNPRFHLPFSPFLAISAAVPLAGIGRRGRVDPGDSRPVPAKAS